MPLKLSTPTVYLITSGATTPHSSPASEDFQQVLKLVAAAVTERVPLIQLREKNLSAHALFQLATQAARLTRGSQTSLLVNDRPDIAAASRAGGVHLTTRSLPARIVRRAFGSRFVIGVSTHTLLEARAARDDGADFAVFGPIFETPSKLAFGPPLGLDKLTAAAQALKPFPLLALGGITRENAASTLQAGASGIAGISIFGDNPQTLKATMSALRALVIM
jgi:thiamine-phosphate pyrophosphorylase